MPGSTSSITLASLNLHAGLTSRGEPFDVAEACHRLKADIITLQEVWLPDGQQDGVTQVAAELGATVRHRGLASRTSRARLGVGTDSGPGSWGLAVLSLLPITGYQEIEPRPGPRGPDHPRGPGAHGDHPGRYGAARGEHPPDPPVHQPGPAGRAGLAAGRRPPADGDRRGPEHAPAGHPGGAGLPLGTGGRTFPAGLPLIQLDHLLVRGRVRVSGGEVLDPVGSDHLPIRAQLSVG